MKSFINEDQIITLLAKTKDPPKADTEKIIEKSKKLKGLALEETAILLQNSNPELDQKLFQTAKEVKEKIYGKRLVLFAPLYLTNHCVNNCLYCGFRKDNKLLERKALTLDEVEKEVKILVGEGHKRILLVAGEDPKTASLDFLKETIEKIYTTKNGKGEIRRININVAPMSTEKFKELKQTGIGTYQLFQETYHYQTYRQVHPSGPKSDYQYRLYAMHRAQEAGIDDVGIGVLFGLYNYKFEVLALLSHCLELEKQFGVGPHTISVPRIEPALNTPLSQNPPFPVSDHDFKRIVAILRLAIPYTGMILSTRETIEMRNNLFNLGISQISAGSRTTPGGYEISQQNQPHTQQFSLHDSRSLLEVVKDISKMGNSPSFCTACYRLGRTGEEFMNLAKPGTIQNFCLPNSLLTYKEYLLDYGDQEAQEIGRKVIAEHLKEINNEQIKKLTIKKLEELETGKRDLYF